MSIAFQGERGAFTELAAIEYFSGKKKAIAKAIAFPEWKDVFRAVEQGKTSYGIIPIENSLGGSIHSNYDLLLLHDLFICGEIYLKIAQILMANKGTTINKVRKIFSHPQGFEQCKNYLEKLGPVTLVPVSNTAAAAKMIKDEGIVDGAAISSMQAVIDYDLRVLARDIEDEKGNITRFLILSKNRKQIHHGKPMKTSVVFSLKNSAGSLFRALSVFALRDIDLLKIESRPVKGKPFEYMFYLDFAGSENDERQRNAINHLREITVFCRVLGSYPVGKLARPEYKKR
jgi:prephenate dehydratase